MEADEWRRRTTAAGHRLLAKDVFFLVNLIFQTGETNMSERKFLDKYWRKAKPEDSVKDPPMVARFRDNPREAWWIDELHMWDRTLEGPWVDSEGSGWGEAEVYDAPPLVASYVPFTWDDQYEFLGKRIEFRESNELIRLQVSEISRADGTGALRVHGRLADLLLRDAKFVDTGKPFGKEVFKEVSDG